MTNDHNDLSAGDRIRFQIPPAYDGCGCFCHTMPGVHHVAPCCYPPINEGNTMTTKYELVVKSYKDESFRDVIATRNTERELERTENGVNINLNHEDYYTAIEEVES